MLPSNKIADHLHNVIMRIMGFSFPPDKWLYTDWSFSTAEQVENASKMFISRDSENILVWQTRSARKNREAWVESLKDTASLVVNEAQNTDATSLREKFKIERTVPTTLPSLGDFVLTKVNHGFWEQLFLITHDGYNPHITRPTALRGYRAAYLDSYFLDAFMSLCRDQTSTNESCLAIDGMIFGVSFSSGDQWHEKLLATLHKLDAEKQRIVRGVYAGLSVFLSGFPTAHQACFYDGAYAKQFLLDGSLSGLLEEVSSKADHVVFVVPSHLSGIHFTNLPLDRQTVLHVSGRVVHQAWPVTLAGVANPILMRLAAGEQVAVVVQAAVFSALLPLYLLQAKKKLGLTGRLSFLDLGQALDVLTPETGSIWIKRQESRLSPETNAIPLALKGVLKNA